jgi:ABC-type Fe3+-citrate transport system substrate-binding protein
MLPPKEDKPMNRTKTVLVVTGLLVAVVMAAGCASSSGYKQADRTSDQMGGLREGLDEGKTQISETITALNDLQSTSNVAAAFESYRKELKATEALAQRVRKRADEMRKKGAEYFKAWEQQLEELSSDELRGRASERRTELLAAFDRISEASQALTEAYGPLMDDLRDIATFLSADLTPAGINTISDVIKKAGKDAAVVNKRIDDVIEQIDDTVAKFGQQ